MATALITGGTSGIGAAFARALAERGDDLVLVARDADRLSETATDLKERYAVSVETIAADLAVRSDVVGIAERLASVERPIDLLVNNAGFAVRVRLTAADTTPHEHAIDVMIRAVLMLGAAAGRAMRQRGAGTIINVSSTAGFVAMGGYSAIKSWVTSYSESLANELHGTGVKVVALCPGWVRTEFHERAEINMSSIPPFLWLDADRLVADCLDDAAAGKVISIPSKRYKVLMTICEHLPHRAMRAVSRKLTSSRH
ncbi:MAG TPA: SDR family NAD(P)-dependent oxidoreductase [Propionibacteriaceae bacterium]|nr:SDR family NAD(P)-dependent oxidoreductase [Propionibacteriaceae bacterium]